MEWISVKDKLPEIDQDVLAFGNDEDNDWIICRVTYMHNSHTQEYFWEIFSSGCGCCDTDLDGVTHWMPLPPPPSHNGMD